MDNRRLIEDFVSDRLGPTPSRQLLERYEQLGQTLEHELADAMVACMGHGTTGPRFSS